MTRDQLQAKLNTLDGRDYRHYQSLTGEYDFTDFRLVIERIPKDPFAPPLSGLYRVSIPLPDTAIEQPMIDSPSAAIACRDFFARQFYRQSQRIAGQRRGTGHSGIIAIDQPGQAILQRSSVVIQHNQLEVRFFIGLPATGRNIDAALAIKMLLDELPLIVSQALQRAHTDVALLQLHIHTALDAQYLRHRLPALGLLAFIADGSILPRASSSSDQPLASGTVIPFQSPDSLSVQVTLPFAGEVSGMGIAAGITLLAGGGFHGKSTLLQALQMGVYDHIPGDGRERCVALSETVKIKAYSGRQVIKTDISPFINNLPLQRDTQAFSSNNASGSTSQAASIIEAIEMGARVLLMDEDTCATNFMIRDRVMQQLVKKEDEPLTAYIDKVRQLYRQKNISTILALGGAGDYLEVADRVIQMRRYQAFDVTLRAREIVHKYPSMRIKEDQDTAIQPALRCPDASSIDPMNEYQKPRLHSPDVQLLQFGRHKVDLQDLEQLIELAQNRAIAYAMLYARRYMQTGTSLPQVIDQVMSDIQDHGLDILSEQLSAHLAEFRSFELAFTLNRLPCLRINTDNISSPY
ncbi:MAG: ABC-ATPase domain-containing protein [Gammaproteobacteria bacterium]|nr:ABC-ATPase domain-containing protein [Gammaproteobacteria bacterium]